MVFSKKIDFDHQKVTKFPEKRDFFNFFFQFFFHNFQFHLKSQYVFSSTFKAYSVSIFIDIFRFYLPYFDSSKIAEKGDF